MKYNRLEHFKNDSRRLNLYRKALALLYECGADYLLAELNAVNTRPVQGDPSKVLELNALNNQKAIGYAECLSNLFELDTMLVPIEKLGSPDFGARDKMIAEKLISEDEAADLFDD